jgi:hypothetical protein
MGRTDMTVSGDRGGRQAAGTLRATSAAFVEVRLRAGTCIAGVLWRDAHDDPDRAQRRNSATLL